MKSKSVAPKFKTVIYLLSLIYNLKFEGEALKETRLTDNLYQFQVLPNQEILKCKSYIRIITSHCKPGMIELKN